MNRIDASFLVWFAVLASGGLLVNGFAFAAEPAGIRVLSYNIHHAEGVDRKLDLARIAQVILAVNPDIVALQEVDQNAKRSGTVDQPAELARLTGMNVVFGANIELQGGHYGNAVLSRFKIVRDQNHLLPNLENGEQRGVIEAEIATATTDSPILFLATHFDHRRDDQERIASADAINRLIAKRLQQPAVLAGDLNDVSGSETLSRLQSRWKITNETPLATIPVGQPTRQIDFVLVRPADRWRVNETRVLDEDIASDHRAILSVLEPLPQTDE